MPAYSPQNKMSRNQRSNQRPLPPGQQLVAAGKWPIIGEREPARSELPCSLEISGLVPAAVLYSLDQLQALPQTRRRIDIHCVTRWSKLDVDFTGVLLADLLAAIDLDPAARFISFVSRSQRNHASSMSLQDALRQETLIALTADGAPLPENHGGPIRNIVPGRYFYKSVKWLQSIELMAQDRLGYWEAEAGYHNNANPWNEERYMSPAIDRRTAIKLIETRNFSDRDLRSIDASGRDLSGLKASNSQLRDANFRQADLSHADFSRSNLSNAHFENANLQNVNFTDADLEGANFAGANLRGACFVGCHLIGSSFCEFDDNGQPVRGAKFDSDTALSDGQLVPLVPRQLQFVQTQISR